MNDNPDESGGGYNPITTVTMKCIICREDMHSKSKGVLDTASARVIHESCQAGVRKEVEAEVKCCTEMMYQLHEFSLIRYNVFDNCYSVYYKPPHVYGSDMMLLVNNITNCMFCGKPLFLPDKFSTVSNDNFDINNLVP